MHFGPYPQERELPPFVRKQTPEELALLMLRRQNALEAEHRKDLAAAQKTADRLAEQLSLLVHKKRFTENDPFVLSLRQLLRNEGILLITHVGEEVTDTLEDEADIVEWLPPGDDPADRVEDALEPEVHWQGRLLHRAKLSCRQSAEEEIPGEPAPSEIPEETAPEEGAAAADGPSAESAPPAEPAPSKDPQETVPEETVCREEVSPAEPAPAEVLEEAAPEETVPQAEVSPAEPARDHEEEARPEPGPVRRLLYRIRSWFSGRA